MPRGMKLPNGQQMLSIALRGGVRVDVPDPASVDKSATVRIQRPGGEWKSYSYTWQMATEAHLTGKRNWKNHPREMLIWRAISVGLRFEAPDVIGGLHMVEEIDPDRQIDAQGVPVEPVVIGEPSLTPVETEPAQEQEAEIIVESEEHWSQNQQNWTAFVRKIAETMEKRPPYNLQLVEREALKLLQIADWSVFETGKAAYTAWYAAYAATFEQAAAISSSKWDDDDFADIEETIEAYLNTTPRRPATITMRLVIVTDILRMLIG